MYLHVDTSDPPAIGLREPDDFRGFKLVVSGDGALADALSQVGRLSPAGDALVRVQAVKELAGKRAHDAAWLRQFEAMIDYARTRGWLDDDGVSVRAHLEHRSGAQSASARFGLSTEDAASDPV